MSRNIYKVYYKKRKYRFYYNPTTRILIANELTIADAFANSVKASGVVLTPAASSLIYPYALILPVAAAPPAAGTYSSRSPLSLDIIDASIIVSILPPNERSTVTPHDTYVSPAPKVTSTTVVFSFDVSSDWTVRVFPVRFYQSEFTATVFAIYKCSFGCI
jgi:hypothetical protein